MRKIPLPLLLFLALALSLPLLSACTGDDDDDDDDDGVFYDPLNGSWVEGFALPGPSGAGAQVFAAVTTSSGVLYVGGTFEQVGDAPARNVASWDGTSWTEPAAGLPGIVRALAITSAGTLVAGGELGTPNRLYTLTGSTWTAIPGEISGVVYALEPFGDGLLVGGSFDDAGATGADSIAFVGGDDSWTSLSGAGLPGTVKAISVVDADSFCVGGAFSDVDAVTAANIACNDAGTWTQLGDGLPGEVNALVRDGAGDWIAGGTFAFIVDPMTGEYRASLGKLVAGTWEPLAGGVDGGFINDVRALAVEPGGDLLVGGCFETVGDATTGIVSASNFARLSGTTWEEVGGGVVNLVGVFLPSAIGVNVIVPVPGGEVAAGGLFSHAGDAVASNLAVTSAGSLVATVPAGDSIRGISGFADAIAVDAEGAVWVGGSFAGVGDVPAQNVARLTATGWDPLGGGISGIVRAIDFLPDGTPIAGGEVSGLRRYDGDDWTPFAGGVEFVFDLLVAENGDIYAAGDFEEFILRWDGEAWQSLDGGLLDGRPTSMTFDDRGRLVVGGLFTESASGVVLDGIGRFSGGEWHAYGDGLDGENGGYVSDVALVGGDTLVIAGQFDQVGGQPARSLARWDGDAWVPFGDLPLAFDIPPTLVDVEPYGDGFFLTGTFTEIPSGDASYIAWYDGSEFHPLAEGLSDLAEELRVGGTTFWAGGTFVDAGGRVSSGIAAWEFPPLP